MTTNAVLNAMEGSRANEKRASSIADLINEVTREDTVDAVTDMLTNLRHYCERAGIDFYRCDILADEHFDAECAESVIKTVEKED